MILPIKSYLIRLREALEVLRDGNVEKAAELLTTIACEADGMALFLGFLTDTANTKNNDELRAVSRLSIEIVSKSTQALLLRAKELKNSPLNMH